MLDRLRTLAGRSASHLALLLVLLAALGSLAWLWGSVTQRANTNFLPHRPPAQWILYPSTPSAYNHSSFPLETLFEKEFVLSQAPATAAIRVAGFHRYSLAINGTALDSVSHPGHNWKRPDLIDVSKQLRVGTNLITVRVVNSNGPPALWLALESGGRTLASGEDWRASCAGASWRAARLAERPPPDPAGSPLHWTGRALDCWREEWLTLLFFAALFGAAYWFVTRRKPQAEPRPGSFRQSEVFVLVGLAVLWTALFLNDMRALPGRFGFDISGHLDYVRYILEHKSLPERNEMWEASQPPVYYLICAGLVKVFSLSLSQESGVQAIRLLGLPVGIAHILLVWASLRLLFPGQSNRPLWGLLLAAALPALLCLCQYVSNEALGAALMTASIYLTLRLLRQQRLSWPGCAGLGLCLGAALLTKATALLLVPLIFGALLWRWFERQRTPFWQSAAGLGIVMAFCLPAVGWHYTHFFGAPHIFWQDLGYTTCAYFLRFGRSFYCPWFAGGLGFADGLYSTLWADGLVSGRSALQFGPPWNYGLMAAGCWLALVPSCAVVLGGMLALRKFIRQPAAEWGLVLGLGFLAPLALIHRYLTNPNFASVKAFYLLGAVVPFCAFGAWGLEALANWSRKGRAILWVLLGVWATASYSSFWILPSSSSSFATTVNSLSSSGRFAEAAEALRTRLQNGPEDAQLRAQLAYTLSRMGAWTEAAEQAKQAIQEQSGDASGYLTLATVLASQGRMPEAIEQSRRAVEAAPGDSRATEQLASLYLAQSRLDEAVGAARDGLGVDPFRASLRCLLARALAAHGDAAEATSQLELAAGMAPQQAEPQVLLGLLLARQRRPAEAEAHLTNAIRLDPRNAACRLELAQVLGAQAKFTEAAAAALSGRDLALASGQKELASQAQKLADSFAAQQSPRNNQTSLPGSNGRQ